MKRLTVRKIVNRMNRGIPEQSNQLYMRAEELFVAGRIPVAQAVGMMLSDCDYRAECELSGRDARVYAECIVRDQWARRLLEVSHG